jgi:predicted lipoprotein with Yx(FWY)xxD motif
LRSGILAQEALPGGRQRAILLRASLELARHYLHEGALSRTRVHLEAARDLLDRSAGVARCLDLTVAQALMHHRDFAGAASARTCVAAGSPQFRLFL